MKTKYIVLLFIFATILVHNVSAAWWQSVGNDAYYNPTSNLLGVELNSTGTSTISLWNGVRVDYAINSSTIIDTDTVKLYFTSSIGSPYNYGDRNISVRVETDDGTGNMSGNLVAPNMTGKINHSVGFISIPLNSSYLFNGTDGIIHFNISTTAGNSANYFRLQGLNQNTARLKMYKNGSIVSGIPIVRWGNSSEKVGNIYTTFDLNNVFGNTYEGEQFELTDPITVNQTCIVMKWNTGETSLPRYVLSGLAQGEILNVTNSTAITTSAGSVCFNYTPVSLPESDVYTAYVMLQDNTSTSGVAVYRLYTSQVDTYGTWGGVVNVATRFDGTSWTTDDRYDVQMTHNVIGSQGTIPVTYYISGYVFSNNGSALGNAEVSDGITGNMTTTDSNGFYNLTGMSNATHTIFGNKTGFDSNSINVDVNGSAMTNQNITLFESVVPTPPQNGSGVVLTMAMRKTTAYGNGGNWRLQIRNQSGYLFYDYNAKNITGFTSGLVGGTRFSINLTGIQLGSDYLKVQIWGNRTSFGGPLFQFFDINVTKDGIPLRYSLANGASSNADWYYRVVTDDAGVIKMGTVSLTQDRYAELQTSIISEAPELKVSPMSIALNPDVYNTTVGSNVFVNTTVWNLGNVSESAATLKLYVNDSLVQTSSSFAVTRLANTTKSLNFTLTGKPTKIRVQVVPSDSNIEGSERNNNVTTMILQRHPNVWVTNVSDLPIKKYGNQEPYISWNATIITNANAQLSTKFGTTRGFNGKVNNIEDLALGYMMTNKSSYAEVAIQGLTNITCTCTTFGTSDVNAPYVGISTYGSGNLARAFDYLGDYIYRKDQNLYRSIQKNLSSIMYYNAMYTKGTTFYETGETVNRFVLDGDSAAFQQNTGISLSLALLDQNSSDVDAYQELQDMKGAYFDRHYLGMNTEKNIFASTVYGDGWKPEANYRKYIARFTYSWIHGYQNLFGTLYDEYPIAKGFVLAPIYTSGLWGQKPQYGAGSNEVYTETYSIPALLSGVEQQYAQYLPSNFANADSWWLNIETDRFFKEKEYNMEDLRQIYYNASITPLPPKFKNTYGYDFSYVNSSNGLAILRSGWNPDDLWCGFKAYYGTRSGGHHSGDGGMGIDCAMDGAYAIGDAGDARDAYGSGESNTSLRKYGSISNGFQGESSLIIDGGTYTRENKAYINTSYLSDDIDFVEGEAVVSYYRANGLTTGSETESSVSGPPTWNRSIFMIAGDYFILTDRMTSVASHAYSQQIAFGGTNFYDAGTSTFENDTFIGNITVNNTTPLDWFNTTQSFGETSKITWDTPKEKNYYMTSTATIELNVYLIPQTTVTIDKSLLNWGRSYGYDAWRPHMMSAQSGTNVKYLTILHPRNQTGNEVNLTVTNLTVSGGSANDYAAKIRNGSKMDEVTISDGAVITTSGNHSTDAMQSFSRYNVSLNYFFIRNGSKFNYSTADYFLANQRVIYAHENFTGNNITLKISGTNGTNITLKVPDNASNYTVYRNGILYTNFGVKDSSHLWANLSLSEAIYEFFTSQSQTGGGGNFIPPTPINITNTTGNYWVNHTWNPGIGNVTDSYNVNVNGAWTNGTANTFKNTTTSSGGWVNISVYSYNSSGNGMLNSTSISMSTQAPAGSSTYIPSIPVSLANTSGSFWVNNTWQPGTGNISNSYNISVNGSWTNGTTNTFYNNTVAPHGWSNITISAYNTSSTGALSLGQNISQLETPGSVTSLLLYGQTFTVSNGSALDTVSIYGNLSGTRTMTIYESPSKAVIYGNAVTTGPIGDAWNTWNFSSLGLGKGSYYYEFLAETVYRNNVDSYLGGDLYVGGSIWSGQDMTFMLNMSAGVSMNTQVSNNAPVLASIGNKTASTTQYLNFTISATDADSDPLAYNTTATKGTFNTTTGSFSWLPTASDVGTYHWTFNVTDNYGATDNETITITVNTTGVPSAISWSNNKTNNSNLTGIILIRNEQIKWNATFNQSGNISWWYDIDGSGTVKQWNNETDNASFNDYYTIIANNKIVRAMITNVNGSANVTWTFDLVPQIRGYIYETTGIPRASVNLNLSYLNGSYLSNIATSDINGSFNFSTSIFNGTYRVFATWANESSIKSDNFSVNSTHGEWINMTLVPTYAVNVGQNVYVNLNNSFDFEGNTIVYSSNRTDLFVDFSSITGKGNWTPSFAESFPVKFGASDGNRYTNKTLIFAVSGADASQDYEEDMMIYIE